MESQELDAFVEKAINLKENNFGFLYNLKNSILGYKKKICVVDFNKDLTKISKKYVSEKRIGKEIMARQPWSEIRWISIEKANDELKKNIANSLNFPPIEDPTKNGNGFKHDQIRVDYNELFLYVTFTIVYQLAISVSEINASSSTKTDIKKNSTKTNVSNFKNEQDKKNDTEEETQLEEFACAYLDKLGVQTGNKWFNGGSNNPFRGSLYLKNMLKQDSYMIPIYEESSALILSNGTLVTFFQRPTELFVEKILQLIETSKAKNERIILDGAVSLFEFLLSNISSAASEAAHNIMNDEKTLYKNLPPNDEISKSIKEFELDVRYITNIICNIKYLKDFIWKNNPEEAAKHPTHNESDYEVRVKFIDPDEANKLSISDAYAQYCTVNGL